jgi:hypothetical protein
VATTGDEGGLAKASSSSRASGVSAASGRGWDRGLSRSIPAVDAPADHQEPPPVRMVAERLEEQDAPRAEAPPNTSPHPGISARWAPTGSRITPYSVSPATPCTVLMTSPPSSFTRRRLSERSPTGR